MTDPTDTPISPGDGSYDPLDGVPEPPPYRPDPLLITYIEKSYPPIEESRRTA